MSADKPTTPTASEGKLNEAIAWHICNEPPMEHEDAKRIFVPRIKEALDQKDTEADRLRQSVKVMREALEKVSDMSNSADMQRDIREVADNVLNATLNSEER